MAHSALRRLYEDNGLSYQDVSFLEQFTDAEIAHLAQACRLARAKRESDLSEAIDNGLRAVPFLLRTPIRKVLFS